MGDQQGQERKLPDPTELTRTMTEIADTPQRLVTDFLQKQSRPSGDAFGMSDPLNIGQAFLEMTARLMTQPEKLVQAQMSLWNDYMNLWQTTARRLDGGARRSRHRASAG